MCTSTVCSVTIDPSYLESRYSMSFMFEFSVIPRYIPPSTSTTEDSPSQCQHFAFILDFRGISFCVTRISVNGVRHFEHFKIMCPSSVRGPLSPVVEAKFFLFLLVILQPPFGIRTYLYLTVQY